MFAPLFAAMLMQQASDFTPVEPEVSDAVKAIAQQRGSMEDSD